jgi:pyruvate formate lyase activating enzyme
MFKDAWQSQKINDNTIECLACSHRCKISKGQTGICGVRKNISGTLKLLVYGRAVGINVDPMEKKPLFHFYPGSQIFSIATVGCNFRCLFCQNWYISQYHKSHTHDEIQKSGQKLSPKQIVKYCLDHKIGSVSFTYNEPGIFFEYAYDTAKLAKEKDLKTVYVSNGFESREALEKIKPYLDAINTDLKGNTEEFYRKICGARMQPVKDNIKWIWEQGIWQEVTTLVIPNLNDSEKDLTEIAEFLASVSKDMPWHISRYFPAWKMTEPPTPVSTLEKAYNIGKKAGLKYVYIGNVPDPGKEDTYCPKCKKTVIKRSGYYVENYLKGDKCPDCKEIISGKF